MKPVRPPLRVANDPDVRLRSIIYAWPIYRINPVTGLPLSADPETGLCPIRYDYIGQTVRALHVRAAEHLDDKPWADLVAADLPIVLAEGVWTKAERDAQEVAAIRRLGPIYNHDDNLHNPARIEIYRQLDQRHARDRAAGRPLWIPVAQRSTAAQAAAVRAEIRAGLDGQEPRYPVDLAWQGLRALARSPRWVKTVAAAATMVAAGGTIGADALVENGWPGQAAQIAGYGIPGLLAATAAGNRKIRRWALRPRRRRRPRR